MTRYLRSGLPLDVVLLHGNTEIEAGLQKYSKPATVNTWVTIGTIVFRLGNVDALAGSV
jgi:hypothetical protein